METKYVIFDSDSKRYFTYNLNGEYHWVRNIKDAHHMDKSDAKIIIPRLNKGIYEIVEIIINN